MGSIRGLDWRRVAPGRAGLRLGRRPRRLPRAGNL